MNENLQWELNEIIVQLNSLGKFNESNSELLEAIYEERLKPIADLLRKADADRYNTVPYLISEMDEKIDFMLNGKSGETKKQNYNDAKDYLLNAVYRLVRN